MVEMGWMDLVAMVEVLEGMLFHNVVFVLENCLPVEVVGLAVLGTLEEAVHELVVGLPECGSFEVWRRLVRRETRDRETPRSPSCGDGDNLLCPRGRGSALSCE